MSNVRLLYEIQRFLKTMFTKTEWRMSVLNVYPPDEQVIELILDNSGQIPSGSFRTISTVVEWIKLWETGDIANESKWLHNPKIIRLGFNDINIPKLTG